MDQRNARQDGDRAAAERVTLPRATPCYDELTPPVITWPKPIPEERKTQTSDKPCSSEETKALFSALRQTLRSSSTFSDFAETRRAIHEALGITGKGAEVCLIEVGKPSDLHGRRVLQVLYSMAPDVRSDSRYMGIEESEAITVDSRQGLDDFLERSAKKLLDNFTRELRTVLDAAEQKPSMRVVSASLGMSHADYCSLLFESLELQRGQGAEKEFVLKNMRQVLYGGDGEKLSPAAKWEKIAGYVERFYAGNEAFKKCRGEYRRAVEEMDHAGLILLIAAGNGHGKAPAGAKVAPEAEVNWLAERDYTLVIGASDSNDTLSKHDDRVSSESVRAQVDLFAPGAFLPLTLPGTTKTDLVNGTSYSAPLAAGTIALMLQADPRLSNDDIRRILGETSYELSDDASGTRLKCIDPVKAVLTALRRK